MAWRPFKSARRDLDSVYLGRHGHDPRLAYWHRERRAWIDERSGSPISTYFRPTHWQPEPSPPPKLRRSP